MNNILQKSTKAFARELKNESILCISILIATILVNTVVVVLRTDENHYIMLIINIVTDIFSGVFVFAKVTVSILPKYRKYKLFSKKAQTLVGKIVSVSGETLRYMHFDCHEVRVDNRVLFLPADTIELKVGCKYKMSIVSNIIIEVAE